MIEQIQWIMLCSAWIFPTVYSFTLQKRIQNLEREHKKLSIGYNAAIKLIITETARKEEYTKALKRLTDPELIADDMEKGARLREMHDANRTTLPREDAGPPAKIYSPKLRAKVPKSNYKRTNN